MKIAAVSLAALVLAGCAGSGVADRETNAPLFEGPPVTNIITAYDRALSCLSAVIPQNRTFAVGEVSDQTGKYTNADEGTGSYITQGAGDMVQAALHEVGVPVVNRRDPRVMQLEAQWGVSDTANFAPSDFFITGSINTLDFLPGGGADVRVAGVGPRYRQYRAIVGLDLAMTNTRTGEVVASSSLMKQIVGEEVGIGVANFFGEYLVEVDIGGGNREAMQFALRPMLKRAVFDLLTGAAQNDMGCRQEIDELES